MDNKEVTKIVKIGVEKLENIADITWHTRNQDKLTKDKFILIIENSIIKNINLDCAAGYEKEGFSKAMRRIVKNIPDKPNYIHWNTYILYLAGYKLCSKCNTIKFLEQFSTANNRQDNKQSLCKKCNSKYKDKNKEKIDIYQKEYRSINKEDLKNKQLEKRKKTILHIIKIMKRKDKLPECQICGYKENWAALDFHHINNKVKRPEWAEGKHPGKYILGVSKELAEKRYLYEIDNLELICSNCHREIHNPIWDLYHLYGE